MDTNSKIIAYDVERGEPRATPQAKALAKTHGATLGDCVNCYRCVQVCPVGIDIRRGVQMECIACTGCADACDEVMTKINKPTGLIRYDTLAGLKKIKAPLLSGRSIFYGGATAASIGLLIVLIEMLSPIDINFLRATEAPYQVVQTPAGDSIVNHFNVEVSNRTADIHQIDFLSDSPVIEFVSAPRPFVIERESIIRNGLFLRSPKVSFKSGQSIVLVRVIDTDMTSGKKVEYLKEVRLVGPLG